MSAAIYRLLPRRYPAEFRRRWEEEIRALLDAELERVEALVHKAKVVCGFPMPAAPETSR